MNPCERSIAKLNFALQNVAISRSVIKSMEEEDKLRSGANCMADIRRLGSEDQDLKSEFIDSMEECRILLADRFSRLENVNIIQPACDKEIIDVSNQFLKIDADHFNGDISGLKKADYFASPCQGTL